MNNIYKGYGTATLAAACNGLVGVLSVTILNLGLPPLAIVFYKCIIGFVIITMWLVLSKQFFRWLNYLKLHYIKIAICSFFIFFVSSFFETQAYHYLSVPNVVFILLGSATITTCFLSISLKNPKGNIYKILATILALLGLWFEFRFSGTMSGYAVLLAVIAGVGYGGFLFLGSKLNIGSGLIVLNSLFLGGILYLGIAVLLSNQVSYVSNLHDLLLLTILALVPTIGGLWCTTFALLYLPSNVVQLLELTEPLFAIVFAYILLHQLATTAQIVGGVFILTAIYLNHHLSSH